MASHLRGEEVLRSPGMFILMAMGFACTPAPVTPAPVREPTEAPPVGVPPISPPTANEPAPTDSSVPSTLFFAATPSGWIPLGCLNSSGEATAMNSCHATPPGEIVLGGPGGQLLPLHPELAITCEPTEQSTRGHLPLPAGDAPRLAWWPPNNSNYWLPASRSPLPSALLPRLTDAAETGFSQRGYGLLDTGEIEFHRVYQGDLDHNGQEDLLVEATMPRSEGEEDPPPSVLLLVSDTTEMLAPEGLDHTGSIELVGSWDTGTGSSVVLLQTFWAGGTGTHLVGFNAGKPTLLGQWVCGT